MDGSLLTYEELTGARGRRILYRSRRMSADAVLGDAPIEVTCGGQSCHLRDISMTGMALLCPDQGACVHDIGAHVPVVIRIGNDVLLSSAFEMRRTDITQGAQLIGLTITDAPLDIDALRAHAAKAKLARRVEKPGKAVSDLPVELRAHSTDVLAFLGETRAMVEHDATLVGYEAGSARMEEAFAACIEPFASRWQALCATGDALLANAPDGAGLALRGVMAQAFGESGAFAHLSDRSMRQGLPGNAVFDRLLTHAAGRTAAALSASCLPPREAMVDGLVIIGGGSPYMAEAFVDMLAGMPEGPSVTVIDWRDDVLQALYAAAAARNQPLALSLASREAVLSGEAVDDGVPGIHIGPLADTLEDEVLDTLVKTLMPKLTAGGTLSVVTLSGKGGLRWTLETVVGCDRIYRDATALDALLKGADGESRSTVSSFHTTMRLHRR